MKSYIIFILCFSCAQLWSQCPPVSITLTTQQEVNSFQADYPNCTDLQMGLTIGPSSNISNLNGLSMLSSIENSLSIRNNSMLQDVSSLQNLNSISGGIDISNNELLAVFDLSDVIVQGATNYNVRNNENLTSALLPTSVNMLSGFLQYRANPLLESISEMENLATVAGQFNIFDTQIELLPTFTSLTSIGNGIALHNNLNITQIPLFPSLNEIVGGISVEGNPLLTDFDLSMVNAQNATGYQVYNNPLLTSALLPTNVTTLSGILQYRANPLLESISEMESLATVEAQFNIFDTQIEPLPTFSSLTSIGNGIALHNNLNITQIPLFPSLNEIVGGISVEGNPLLTDFDLSMVNAQNATGYQVYNNPLLTSALLPTNVTTLSGILQYRANPLLESISEMESLATVEAQFNIFDTQIEPLPTFSSLTSIGNGIALHNNLNITQIPLFPSLNEIVGGISVEGNPLLTDFDLSMVNAQNATGYQVYNNPLLTSALLPTNVTALSGILQYRANPLLESISEMESLATVEAQFNIFDTQIEPLPTFSSLTSIGNGIALHNNLNITQIPLFPSLNEIVGGISVEGNPLLTDFDLSMVNAQNATGYQVYNNPLLTSALLPTNVTALTGLLQYRANPLLSEISEMNQLMSIGQQFNIWETLLCYLPAYPSLNFIGSGLSINANSNLLSLPYFNSSTQINFNLDIGNNTLLGNCAVDAVCNFLQTTGIRSVYNNAGDCFDEMVLINHCINGPTTLPITFPSNQIANHGESIILSINNLPSNYQAIWYGEDMTTILYQDVANNFEYLVDQSTTIYGLYSPIANFCIADLIPVEIEVNCSDVLEICDGIDNNGNGQIDEGFDLDNDGITSCAGDCDENDPDNFPGNVEICDGQDNNCDGQVDEGFDLDCDGIPDCSDNCPEICNPDQLDTDCDGIGDLCDQWPGCDDTLDSDYDGIPNCVDLDELDNWACGNGIKVNICHFPQGDPTERFTKCVNANSVQNHLNNHADYIGECEQVFCCNYETGGHPINDTKELQIIEFDLYPNPTSGPITIDLKDYLELKVEISILDLTGRDIWSIANQLINEPMLEIDLSNMVVDSGIYLMRIRSGTESQIRQFVFIN